MSGRRRVYGQLGFGGVGQFENDYAWTDSFDPAYGFDPFLSNVGTGDVPMVQADASGNPATTTQTGNWYDNIIGSVEKLGTAYLSYKQTQDINDVNLERAKQGLAPIDVSTIAPQVRVGFAPDTQNIIMITLLGVGALFVIGMMGGRKRR